MKLIDLKLLDKYTTFTIFVSMITFIVTYGFIHDVIYPNDKQNIIINPFIIYSLALLVSIFIKRYIVKSVMYV